MNRRDGAQRTALLAGLLIVTLGAFGVIALLALNLGPFAGSPGVSPSVPGSGGPATLPATPAPTPTLPVGSPSSQAPATTPSPTILGSPATPEEALLAHIPEPIRPTCTVSAGDGQATLVADCSADDGAISVRYAEYPSLEALQAAFTALRVASGIDPDSGNCRIHATWPAEGTYSVGGRTAGRRLCTDQPGQPTIFWTDDRLTMLATARGADPDRLLDFWLNEAGPVD